MMNKPDVLSKQCEAEKVRLSAGIINYFGKRINRMFFMENRLIW